MTEARTRPNALIAYGAGTDHLAPGPDVTIDDVTRAYEEQVGFVLRVVVAAGVAVGV